MLKITTSSIIDFNNTDNPVKETHTISKSFFGWNYKTVVTTAEQVNLSEDFSKSAKIGFNG